MVMRRCTTNRFEDELYDITGSRGEGGTSLPSSSYSSLVFVVVLVIIFVINFVIKDLENCHVDIGLNYRNAALNVIIGGVDAYVYQRSGLAPRQSRSLDQGRSGTVDEHLQRQK